MPHYCPNDPSHKQFVTTVRFAQDWIVDENGMCIEMLDEPGIEEPETDEFDDWTCDQCGARAKLALDL